MAIPQNVLDALASLKDFQDKCAGHEVEIAAKDVQIAELQADLTDLENQVSALAANIPPAA